MKILLAIYKYFPWGGLQKDCFRIAEEGLRRGHEIHILTTRWEGPRPAGAVLELVRTKGLGNHRKMQSFSRLFQDRLSRGDIQVSLAMNRILGADFYFAADSCLKTYLPLKHPGWLLKLLPRYRIFLSMEAGIFAPESRTGILYIAESQHQDFQAAYGTPETRFTALPPGMNPRCVRPADAEADRIRRRIRSDLGLSSGDLVFILVASGFRLKGGDRVLAALAALPPVWRDRSRLLIVGNVNPGEARACAGKLHLEDRLILAGPRDNVHEYLLAADIMVHPARQEGAGSVLVEAIASGLPVICSGACGFAPYVAASSGYVLQEPYDQEELNRILPDRLDSLRESARKTLAYARTQDFCRRAPAVLDCLEEYVTATGN